MVRSCCSRSCELAHGAILAYGRSAPARHWSGRGILAPWQRHVGAGGLALAVRGGLGYAAGSRRTATGCGGSTVPVLPAGQPDLRVLHLSDLHLTPRQRGRVAWVRALAAAASRTCVVDTGDNLAHRQAVPVALDALEPLLDLPGAFVLGSNDYFAPVPKNPAALPRRPVAPSAQHRRRAAVAATWSAGLTDAGWLDLTNAPRPAVGRRARRRAASASTTRTSSATGTTEVAGPADPAADLALGVTHAPYQRVLDAMAADGAGWCSPATPTAGSCACPGYGALVTNCDLPTAAGQGAVAVRPARLGRRPGPRRRRRPRRLAARVRRAGHLAVRAGAVRLPAGGDAADPHARSAGLNPFWPRPGALA